jgi:hypothetical protein
MLTSINASILRSFHPAHHPSLTLILALRQAQAQALYQDYAIAAVEAI